MIIDIIKMILFGIVEGITEWLPISSTGHMILLEELINIDFRPEFWAIFLVVIQLGAILAVILIYFHRLNPFSPSKTKEERKDTWETWFKVAVGCIPAVIFGFLLDDWMDENLMSPWVVAAALIVYGVLFIIIENRRHQMPMRVENMKELSYGRALGIGFFQSLSIVPGTSRSGSSILGAMILGTSRPVAADFSFFMSIPVMFGASGLRVVKAVFLNGFRFTGYELVLLAVGCVVAFAVSVVTIKFLLRFIQTNDFKPFGWYRIVLGIIVILFFGAGSLFSILLPLLAIAAVALIVVKAARN